MNFRPERSARPAWPGRAALRFRIGCVESGGDGAPIVYTYRLKYRRKALGTLVLQDLDFITASVVHATKALARTWRSVT